MTYFVCTCICRQCTYIFLVFMHSRILLVQDIWNECLEIWKSPSNMDLAYNYFVLMAKHRRLDQSVLTCYYIFTYMYAACWCYIFVSLAYDGILIFKIWCCLYLSPLLSCHIVTCISFLFIWSMQYQI
jgi:hypothetical protein